MAVCTIPSRPLLVPELRQGSGCDYHRVVLPHQYLQASAKVPIYWFNRISVGGPDAVRRLKACGIRIWMDLDDHWQLPADHYLASAWAKNGTGANILAHLQLADMVTVTNAELARHVAHVNPRVVIVPNALPFDEGQFTRSTDTRSGTRLVYVAGASHRADLRAVAGAMDAGVLTVCGENDRNPEWARMRNIARKQQFQPARPIDSYMTLYDGHRAAIAPLARDDAFNRCKSNLKVLEAGAKGLPIIASRYHPYLNDQDRRHVLYANSLSEWRTWARRLVRDRPFAEDAGASLAEHVRMHYQLSAANEIRRQIIESFA